MVIVNGDYVVFSPSCQMKASLYRNDILYRVIATELRNGESRLMATAVDTPMSAAKRGAYNFYPAELFQRVYVRPAGVPENWEIVRVGMPAEWEYYQDPVDGLIYQSVTGAMPPYAAVNVVRSTGPQERGMPSHNPKYADRKDDSRVSPSETSGKESTAVEVEAWAGQLWDQIKQLPTMPLPDGACYVPKIIDGHRQMEFNKYLVNDDIDESSGCWRMVIATPEWLAAAGFKHHVLVCTVGTYSVPCSIS